MIAKCMLFASMTLVALFLLTGCAKYEPGANFRVHSTGKETTITKYTGTAMGAGIGAHFGAFNIYAVTDNVLSVTKIGAPALETASTYRQASARFGIVFAW